MKDNVNSGVMNQQFIQELKAKNNIVSIIAKYVPLEKKGKNFWGCCPFHHEKTPSFCINEYEGFYHCFGCGESGDVISFVRKYEDLSYFEAIKILAENAHMKLPEFENDEKFIKAKKAKERYQAILNIAREYYKSKLFEPAAKPAQEYIRSRRVGKRSLDNFEFGYSPDPFGLVKILTEKGYSPEEMKNSGVCDISKNGKPYDFLAERLIFPIVNSHNDCIGFSGRDLKGSKMMKYKNTSATPIFDKSRAVFAINLIKKLKQEQGLSKIILVEGQFDVVSMHEAGFNNTVACLGTAFTKEHIRELKRFADKIVLCFDGDEAGQKATLRALDTFDTFGEDVDVKAVRLPDKTDPDEFLQKFGADKLAYLIDNAPNSVMFRINNLKEKFTLTTADSKSKFVKAALKVIEKIKTVSEQEIYLAEIKKLTNISLDILRRDLQGLPSEVNTPHTAQEISSPKTSNLSETATIKAERFVVASLLHHKNYVFGEDEDDEVIHTNVDNFCGNVDKLQKIRDISDYILNPSLKKLLCWMIEKIEKNESYFVSNVFDMFDIESGEEENVKAVVEYNFEIINNKKAYFQQCTNLLESEALKFKKTLLSKQYNNETDMEKRKDILNEINKITLKLRNK